MNKIAVVLFLLNPYLYALGEINLDQVEQQIVQVSSLIKKISRDSEALQKILAVRNGFYTNDGDVLRSILLAAAKDRTERDTLIACIQYEKCQKWFWECGLPPISWNKIKFKLFSKLKSDIDALEQTIQTLGNLPNNDFADFDPRSLDPYEDYFQLFAELEPDLGDLLSFLLKFYAGQSLQTLNQEELRKLLEKQISFLDDKENGALGFIRKSRPRS